jgi:hypothetical protein
MEKPDKMLPPMNKYEVRPKFFQLCSTGFICGLYLLTTAVLPALADTTLGYVNKHTHHAATQILIRNGRVRVANPQRQGTAVIYDSTHHRFDVIDNTRQTFTVIDRDTVRRLRSEIARVRHAADMLPGSVRGMIEGRAPALGELLDKPLPKAVVAATGQTATVGGHHCKTLSVSVKGAVVYGLCASAPGFLSIPKPDARTFVMMTHDLDRLAGRNLTLKRGARKILLANWGVPVKAVNLAGGGTEVLKTVGDEKIEAAKMQVPGNYRQVSLVNFLAHRPR